MTFPIDAAATTKLPEHQPIIASESEKAALHRLEQALKTAQPGHHHYTLQRADLQGDAIELPPSARQGLLQLIRYLAAGQAVEVVPTDKELTTQQAAGLLNVSRPYLVRLVEAGNIPCRKLGSHRRLRLADVLAYKQHRDAARRQSLRDLSALSQELGLYDE